MSVVLKLRTINTTLSYPCLVTEDTEYDTTVDMSPVADDTYSFPPQSYPGCFGLPYQDHNYGAPPPPTPPQSPIQMVPVTTKEQDELMEEMVVTEDEPTQQQTDITTSDNIQDGVDDPTRCICDFVHDDGYMIQCDKCSVWQHIVCMGLDRDSIPDVYFCELCNPRPVDRIRAREFQIRKREFLKTLTVKPHDSSTDTDPDEVNNRLRAYGLDQSALSKQKLKMKLRKRKERNNSKNNRRFKPKDAKVERTEKVEKENASNEANRKSKLLVKEFSSNSAQARKEKLSKKIEKMRAERLSKETKIDVLNSHDHKDVKMINNTINSVQDESAQKPWEDSEFNEWEQNYETARYNQYTTYVQEYLNSACINGHHNDIADLVTDGLRVQRCHVKELKNKCKCLEASYNIPTGQPVIEVLGKVMTRQQYDKDNFGQRRLSPFVFFYGTVFDLELVIDSSDYGNDARFIRRSCQSNATIHHVAAGGQAHFIAVSTKEIPEHTEITVPFDYDYKKWNFCFQCACLRNNCPVSRYQKRRLRFQKMQHASSPQKYNKQDKVNVTQFMIKPPVKSPSKSPVESPVKAQEKPNLDQAMSPTSETITVSPPLPSPIKMVRRSQVSRQNSNNVSTQVSVARSSSLQLHSHIELSILEPLPSLPSLLHSPEVNHVTHPEIVKDSTKDPVGQDSQEMPKNEEKRKLTREERKMEAIIKAFEKMEKRNQRKVSVEQPQKPKEKDQIKENEDKDQKKDVKKEKEKQVIAEPEVLVCVQVNKETPKSDDEKIIEVCSPENLHIKTNPEPVDKCPLIIEVKRETVEEKVEEKPVVNQKDKTVPKGKKARRTGGSRWVVSYTSKKRCTRNSSATTSSETHAENQEENSNGPPPPIQVASCPTTPAPFIESGLTPAFRFLKTKRHLMNEWLNEKSSDLKPSCKSEPLDVSIEEENMFVTCLPSPRNSMDRFRRNSQSTGNRDRHTAILMETNAGSAKKRWLRQAMGEGSDSAMSSPVPLAGSTSPNPLVAICSHVGSPPIDFVTPLKKRRLARESLSNECMPSECLSMPSATVTQQSATSYCAGMSDSQENIKNMNGFSTLLSPIRPSNIEMEGTKGSEQTNNGSVITASNSSKCKIVESQVQQPVQPNHEDTQSGTAKGCGTEKTDNLSSCSEKDCNVASDAGTGVCHSVANVQISNVQRINCSEMVNCEQTSICDQQEKSASSEPDSSDSVCKNSEMEVVCDSGSNAVNPVVVLGTSGEIDSTGTSSALHELHTDTMEEKQSDINQCDSCNGEKMDSVGSEKSETPGPSSVSDKLCSSTSSSHLLNNMTGGFLTRFLFDRLSQVDSSTDRLRNSVSETGSSDSDVHLDSTSSIVTSENSQHRVIPNRLSFDNEVVSDSFFHAESNLFTVIQNNAGNSSLLSDSFSATNSSSEVVTSTPNRHLKFLNDNSYSTDMIVDSTTQYMPSIGANNLISNSGLPIIPSYESDSTDVTSASETGLSFPMLDEMRQNGEDSLIGYSDYASSTSNDTSHTAKKKVSLQEYLKRKKEKSSSSSTTASTTSQSLSSSSPTMMGELSTFSVSSTTKKSSLKLSSLISLENLDQKLPWLPSLPSLPMFVKTERREFKSSSDLLSPIFNRKEKQEEVRKQMSLSERLRQEFGLDDCTDNNDTDRKLDQITTGTLKPLGTVDVPPPPPPPQTSGFRLSARTPSNNSSIPSLLSIRTCPPQTKILTENASAALTALVATQQGLQPGPHIRTLKSPLDGSGNTSTVLPQHNSKCQSPCQNPLGTLMSTNKTPQQLQDDLTAQLVAIKAQISKVQQSHPSHSSSLGETSNLTTNSMTVSVNNVQTFEYGHQTDSSFMRQNSNQGSSSANFQNLNTLSPHPYCKSPFFKKVSPPSSHVSPSPGSQSFNGTVNLLYNTQRDRTSPSSWTQSHNHGPKNRKHLANKY